MRVCSIPGCKSKFIKGRLEDGVKNFFKFPRNDKKRLRWLHAMGVADDWKTSGRIVCINHFTPDCIVFPTEARPKISLKDFAVPTIFEHMNHRRRAILKDHTYSRGPDRDPGPDLRQAHKNHVTDDMVVIVDYPKNGIRGAEYLSDTIVHLESIPSKEHELHLALRSLTADHSEEMLRHHRLKEKHESLVVKTKQLFNEVNELKSQISIRNKELEQLEKFKERMTEVFREDQLRFLIHGNQKGKGISWSTHTVDEGLKFLSVCGQTAYEYARKTGWPIPSISVLQRRLEAMKGAHVIAEKWNQTVKDFDSEDEIESGAPSSSIEGVSSSIEGVSSSIECVSSSIECVSSSIEGAIVVTLGP